MAGLFAELVSPERIVFAGEVRSVLLPGVEGDMTVLPGHAPLVTMLHAGLVFATDAAGTGRRAVVRGGLVEVTGTRVTILAERVLPVEELTRDQIDEEILYFQMERDGTANPERRAQCEVSIGRLEEFKANLRL
ncbi:ATP synthase F1 subunit epsilon [Methylobacterium nodulans]|uniref:ATP synthase epsilon chain n=1 Tax=Methylobacterium nodulans (strain LMG 21967 / CNCM I-2342 / ORS 2060) TaxID=460265 RepID=B8IH37_METNO|nr:ATP synthase F1 subunit epsilon [Methylobacterium nodulans]ACL59729.1 ATP synthase F1, epsilon subunit [Methylobacterium nodulans ORS 2060]